MYAVLYGCENMASWGEAVPAFLLMGACVKNRKKEIWKIDLLLSSPSAALCQTPASLLLIDRVIAAGLSQEKLWKYIYSSLAKNTLIFSNIGQSHMSVKTVREVNSIF